MTTRGSQYIPYLLIAPALILIFIFVFYPTLYGFQLSLSEQVPVTGEFRLIGLTNFRNLLTNPEFLGTLVVTFKFAIFYVAIAIVLGLALALVMNLKLQFTGTYLTVIFIPWVLSDVVAGIIWRWMFNQSVGLIELTLRRLHISPAVGMLASPTGVIAVMVFLAVWRSLPFTMLLLLAGLQAISEELQEAAKIDGASAWNRLWSVTLPLLRPQLLVITLLLSIGAINASGIFLTVTDGGPGRSSEVTALYMYHTAFRFFQLTQGSAIAVIMFLINLTLTLIYLRIFRAEYQI